MIPSSFASKLTNFVRETIQNRRQTRRLQVSVPVYFSIVHQTRGEVVARSRKVAAATFDISHSGVAIKTANATIDGLHVSVDPDSSIHKHLEIEMDLPGRRISMKGKPIRYLKGDKRASYIVGIQILAMPPDDRKAYFEFIKTLG